MIPGGKGHNEMIMAGDPAAEPAQATPEEGMVLV